MHAISIIVPGEPDEPIMQEPYWEDDAIAEVGFGYEHVVSIVRISPKFSNNRRRTAGLLGLLWWAEMNFPWDSGCKRSGHLSPT